MASTYPLDPILNHKFVVTVEGIGQIGVSEVTGLENENEVVEYREGQDPIAMRKITGMTSYSNVTIKRGITTNSSEFLQWRQEVIANTMASRRSVIIQISDGTGKPVRTLKLFKAWPVKMTIGDLSSSGNDVLMEDMELAYEGLKITLENPNDT